MVETAELVWQGGESQSASVSAMPHRQDLNRLKVAHFTDEHDVRVFTKSRKAQQIGEGMRVGVDFPLIHQAALVVVKKFDVDLRS